MIHVLKFLIRVAVTLTVWNVCAWMLLILAIIFWDGKFIDIVSDIANKVWGQND